jgi:hypothetical protein
MTKAEVLQELDSLSAVLRRKEPSELDLKAVMAELKRLKKQLRNAPDAPKRSILELKGIGKDMWRGIDVEEYIREMRGN